MREKVKVMFEREMIPDGCVRCPTCKGTGRYRFKWSEPSFHNVPAVNDYRMCFRCMGNGYIPISELKEEERKEIESKKDTGDKKEVH